MSENSDIPSVLYGRSEVPKSAPVINLVKTHKKSGDRVRATDLRRRTAEWIVLWHRAELAWAEGSLRCLDDNGDGEPSAPYAIIEEMTKLESCVAKLLPETVGDAEAMLKMVTRMLEKRDYRPDATAKCSAVQILDKVIEGLGHASDDMRLKSTIDVPSADHGVYAWSSSNRTGDAATRPLLELALKAAVWK